MPDAKQTVLHELVRDVELLFDEKIQEQANLLFQDTIFQNMFDRHAELYQDRNYDKWIEAIDKGQRRLEQIADRLPQLRQILVEATRVGHIFPT